LMFGNRLLRSLLEMSITPRFYRVSRASGERTDDGSTLTTVDAPKRKQGFVPGNRRSARRWMVGIAAGLVLLAGLADEPFWGWWLAFTVPAGILILLISVGRIALFRSKVHPGWGAAPGDRIGPTMPPRSPESPGEPFPQSVPP